MREISTTCCVVGGGPAGMMLGYLLARSGVRVTVLEKHGDFFRDFRGDTVHPSTLDVIDELGMLRDFLKIPHQQITSVGAMIGGFPIKIGDLSHVPARCRFVALMPQWDFLNFLSDRAKSFPSFELCMQHEAVDLTRDGDRVTGVIARGPENASLHVHADLVVGCDGRHSTTRRAGQFEPREYGVPIDVLWFRLSRHHGDPSQVLGNINYGKMLILIDRSDYFQAGLMIRKGSYEEIKANGLEALRAGILEVIPWLGDRVEELKDWDQIRLLTVQINRLKQWYCEGLLCIGDAAHAMSPVGGVGINLAIQDAVATANLLARPLLDGCATDAVLARVQRRREFPAAITQAVQVRAHKALARVFDHPGPIQPPWQLKVIARIPFIHAAVGYAVGMGARPEHVAGIERPPRTSLIRSAVAIGAALGAAVALWRLTHRRPPQPAH